MSSPVCLHPFYFTPFAPIQMKNAPNFRLPFYLALCIKISVLCHKRTLILIQRLAFFLCPESLAPQGFFQFAGCMERAFPLFFGCKRRLMLISPCFTLPVGCMIKRLLVVELVAVLYWVHTTVPGKTRGVSLRKDDCLWQTEQDQIRFSSSSQMTRKELFKRRWRNSVLRTWERIFARWR